MSINELQIEELVVLKSIYDGDDNFKELDKTAPTFQYKICDKTERKSFLLEISWGNEYPEVKPDFSLDAFYNKHLCKKVKDLIINRLDGEAEQCLGTAMTYTIIEWVKENADDLLIDQMDDEESLKITEPTASLSAELDKIELKEMDKPNQTVKKSNLSKQQKKKLFDQLNTKGERPRGWDWVDVVKHLSQSGGSKQAVVAQSE